MAMLVHGRKSISVPTGGAFAGFPAQAVPDSVKFYSPEELEAMMGEKEEPVSTWPGKKDSGEDSDSTGN